VRELPAGTVTFLFTDVEGSTRLLEEFGAERYAEALAEHRRVLREAFAAGGGVEVDTQGDALFVAFASAEGALQAARTAQHLLAQGPIRVRIGLHTGQPLLTAEGYVGMDVHRGARIAAAGHGGQVLVSETTYALVTGTVPETELRDLGEQRLKDLGAPIRLFQFGEGEFPPLMVLYRSTLPVQPSPLVGRERELEEAGALLREHRLMTLTGPGGSGKTRLALQLAAEASDDFSHGVWWVPLQALRDPALVEPAIAGIVGAKDGLAEYVADKRLLLVLDNFEHLVEAAGGLAVLLSETPNLKLLVTSRAPLRIAGEHRYEVAMLPEDDAVALFVERARAIDPGVQPTDAVRAVCRRLDGLPLALELAAARVNVLSPEALLARLERTLPLLTGGARDAPEHQRTLRATIAWSYELLTEAERHLFGRLAVFVGSFDLDAAEAVCDADLDTLQSLLDNSLLRRWDSSRYGMLDTIHEYTAERLDRSGETAPMFERFGRYFLTLAEAAEPELRSARDLEWLDRLEGEHDNLRAALSWFAGSKGAQDELRLAAAIWRMWLTRGHYTEGRRWLEDALARDTGHRSPARAKACWGAAALARHQGDLARATELAEESLSLFTELGDKHGAALPLLVLASASADRGDQQRAKSLYRESAEALNAVGDTWMLGVAVLNLGEIEAELGNLAAARRLYEESLAIARRTGHARIVSASLLNLASAELLERRENQAAGFLRESLALEEKVGDKLSIGSALLYTAAVCSGAPVLAARLLGTAEAMYEDLGASLPASDCEVLHRTDRIVRTALTSAELEQAWTEGRAMTGGEAVKVALAALDYHSDESS
jgi:predicted ATPase/class 3 adenylate cyclase